MLSTYTNIVPVNINVCLFVDYSITSVLSTYTNIVPVIINVCLMVDYSCSCVCYFLLFINLFMRSLFIRMSFELTKELIVAEGKEYTRLDIAQTL